MSKRILALLFTVAVLALCLTACIDAADTSIPDDSNVTTTVATDPTDPGETTNPGETTGSDVTTDPDATTGSDVTDDLNATTGTVGPNTTTVITHTQSVAPQITTVATTAFTTNPNATLAKDKIVDLGDHTMTFGTAWRYQTTITASTLGDILWHERMEEVMDDYNCNIKVVSVYATADVVRTYFLANRSPADILDMLYGTMFMPSLGAGYLQNWNDIPNSPINLADARWEPNQLCVSPFDGGLYGVTFPMAPGEPAVRQVVFANRTLLESNGVNIDDLYKAVEAREWDWDMFRDMAMKATKDTDGNGSNDTWGITGEWGFMFRNMVYSNGGRMCTVKDGKITATMDSAANLEAVAFLERLIKTDKVVYFPESFYSEATWGATYDSIQEFKKGNIAFLFHETWNCDQQFNGGSNPVKFKYSVLPCPIGPKAKEYASAFDLGNCSTMLNNISTDRKTKAAIIYNAWARPVGDLLDYSEELQEDMLQADDKWSWKTMEMLVNCTFLDYGAAVTDLTGAFNHAIVSSVLWGIQSPTAAIESLSGNYDREIAAIFANAPTKK